MIPSVGRLSKRAVAGLSGLIVAVLLSGAASALNLGADEAAQRATTRLETTGLGSVTGTMGDLRLPSPVAPAMTIPPPPLPVRDVEPPAMAATTLIPPPPPPTTAAPTPTTTTAATATAPTATAPSTTVPAAPSGTRTFSVTPNSGPNNASVIASGTGCVGEGAGAGIYLHDPSGRSFSGDGGSAMPDGTWRLPFSFHAGAPGSYPLGQYTVKAVCLVGSTVLFEYTPVTFTLTR